MQRIRQADKGFTLIEMLIVVAVIAVLVGIAIPVFAQQKEKSANETDAYNAKQIAAQLEYYYTANPDKVAHLLAIEKESPGAMEIIVLKDGAVYSTHTNGGKGCSTAADKVVEADMKEALGDYDANGRNALYRCESTETWKQYAVCVFMYNPKTKKATTSPNVFYCAWSDSAAYDGGYKWDNIMNSGKYNTAFKSACGGDIVVE